VKKAVCSALLAAAAILCFSRTPAPVGMVYVEEGTFRMGSTDGESREQPVYTVTISGFYMGKYEVTRKEWTEVMGTTIGRQWTEAGQSGAPADGKGDTYPMYCVNWYETHPVGTKRPNSLGLCDMSGNGWEWWYVRSAGRNGDIPPSRGRLHGFRLVRSILEPAQTAP
jgi:formylglycine-generating enzyme required for sulfatase activity